MKDIDSTIYGIKPVNQQMKTRKTFQSNRKAVQGSLKSLETEIASLQRLIESEKEHRKLQPKFIPVDASQKTGYLLEELALLKSNENDLRFVSDNLEKLRRLNEKLNEIGLAVEFLKKEAHRNDIKIRRERVGS